MKKEMTHLRKQIKKSGIEDLTVEAEYGKLYSVFSRQRRGEKETLAFLEFIGVEKKTLDFLRDVATTGWELGARKIFFYPQKKRKKKKKKLTKEEIQETQNRFLSDFARKTARGVVNRDDIILFFSVLAEKNILLRFRKKNGEKRTFLVESSIYYRKIKAENILFTGRKGGVPPRAYFFGKEVNGESDLKKWIYFDTILSARLEDK